MTPVEEPPAARVDPGSSGGSPEAVSTDRIVVYGAFSSAWSYLASRRAALLAEDGVRVDWRAVEEDGGQRDDIGASIRFDVARR